MTDGLPTALADLLAARLGPEGWLTGADARRRYGEDDSRRWALPGAVALPRDTDDVVAIVQACRAHGVPIVARGAAPAPLARQCRFPAAWWYRWRA